MIDAVTKAIAAKLKGTEYFRTWGVAPFPDLPERVQSASPKNLFVAYEGSTDADETSASTQRATAWSVTVVALGMYGKESATEAVDAVRSALTGWIAPQGGAPFMPTKDGIVGEDQGKWTFVVSFKSALPCIGAPTEETGAPYAPTVDPDHTFDLDTFLNEDVTGGIDPTLSQP